MSKDLRFNLFGGGFQHTVSSTLHKQPKSFSWDYNTLLNDTTFYVDNALERGCKDTTSKRKFGWILESKEIINLETFCIENLQTLKKQFKHIFTHNQFLISLDQDLFKFTPANGTWISDPQIYNKSKNLSMITSNKVITQAQKFRTKFAKHNESKLDLFGRGFCEIDKKEEALEDYMFSICIENGIYKTYYTEKILDCFACGTIPVYLGTPDIGEHFNADGIVTLNASTNLKSLTEDFYYSKMESIKENLEKVKKHYTVEDYIYERFIK